MTDVLAIVGAEDRDEELVEELALRRADRVTVLIEDHDAPGAVGAPVPTNATRERISALLSAIEERTGAIVVGLARSRDQLRGWRFDRIVGGSTPRMA